MGWGRPGVAGWLGKTPVLVSFCLRISRLTEGARDAMTGEATGQEQVQTRFWL